MEPSAIQAENSISVKKYLPTGKMLSSVCFKTRERTSGVLAADLEAPRLQPTAPSRASGGLPGAPALSKASFCFICLQLSNFLFLPKVCKTLGYSRPLPVPAARSSLSVGGFRAERRVEAWSQPPSTGPPLAKPRESILHASSNRFQCSSWGNSVSQTHTSVFRDGSALGVTVPDITN